MSEGYVNQRREPTTSNTPMRTTYWLYVRKVGERDWRRLREFEDEADALIAEVEQKQVSQPQWEFCVRIAVSLVKNEQV